MKLLLDTNVVLDFYRPNREFRAVARKLQMMHLFGDAELWASAKSFTDMFFVLSKDYDGGQILDCFAESFEFLRLCSIDGEDVKLAVEERWVDFEGCLIDIAARKVKADVLVTRDRKGFRRAKTPTMTPDELFVYLEREKGLVYEEIEWDG